MLVFLQKDIGKTKFIDIYTVTLFTKMCIPSIFVWGDFITCLTYVFCVPGCVFYRCPLQLNERCLLLIFLACFLYFLSDILFCFLYLSWPTFVQQNLRRTFVMLVIGFQRGWETDFSFRLLDDMRWNGHFISRGCLPYFQQNIFSCGSLYSKMLFSKFK